ncbi:MAG: hypothetical protein R2838_25455 [Caldilineaceae bacterium]
MFTGDALEVIHTDFVLRTAGKGLPGNRIWFVHAFCSFAVTILRPILWAYSAPSSWRPSSPGRAWAA